MKKKIFIFFESEIFINNFVNTGGLNLLLKNYDCFFIIDETIKDKFYFFLSKHHLRIMKNKIIFYNYSKFERKIFSLLFLRNQIKNKAKSKNISMTITNNFYFKFNFNDNKGINFSLIELLVIIKRILILKINQIFTSNIIDNFLKKLINQNVKIKNLIKYTKPGLLIFPYHGGHISIFDTIRFTKKSSNTKILLLSENWDSIFSRAFINFPDYISFWGNQSKKFFKKNYNEKTKIFCLGAPRLNAYFKFRKKLSSKKKYKIIFYDRAIPDTKINKILFLYIDNLINDNKNNLKNLKFIYRPHPYTFLKYREKFDLKKFKNITLDPSSKKIYNLNNNTSLVQKTKFEKNIKLLNSVDMVICSATSLVIEASILYKNVLIYNVSSKGFFEDRLPSKYEHFKKIDKLNNVSFVNNNEDLGNKILEFYKKKKKPKKKIIDKKRKNILIENNNNSYAHDLLNCVNRILK